MRVETIKLEGHVTARGLIDRLSSISFRLRRAGDQVSLVFDVDGIVSHEKQALVAFIVWYERYRDQVRNVAVVAAPHQREMRAIAAAVAATARGRFRTWARYDQALAWAARRPTPHPLDRT
jgi:hypothetical protein